MTCSKNTNLTLKDTHNIIFRINNIYDTNFVLKNQSSFELCTFGFVVTESLFLNSKSYIETITAMKMNKKLDTQSKDFIQILSAMSMNKKIASTVKTSNETVISFKQNKKLLVEVNLDMPVGKYTLLGQLDGFTLGELDNVQYLGSIDSLTLGDLDAQQLYQIDAPAGNYTLGYLDVGIAGGVNFIAGKKLVSLVKNEMETVTNINKYRLGLLGEYDGLTLGDMDGDTLKDLDLILDN